MGDVDIATGFGSGRALNVVACRSVFNTKRGRNDSMSINRSREAQEEGVSDERLGDHCQYEFEGG